ncbi:transcription termination factor Rho [Nonlabens tegetincola]|uniref:Transcription termination factor Rho n=1 Tax=Nonlabens tegetincola TaxID=323273 RepID=A0A090Q206_9FLAO|nr:transcription termination factor Rho [Nonlabens tegetincola]
MFQIADLKSKKLPELQEIAKDLNVPKYRSLRKLDLVYKILDVQAENPKALENLDLDNKSEDSPKKESKPDSKKESRLRLLKITNKRKNVDQEKTTIQSQQKRIRNLTLLLIKVSLLKKRITQKKQKPTILIRITKSLMTIVTIIVMKIVTIMTLEIRTTIAIRIITETTIAVTMFLKEIKITVIAIVTQILNLMESSRVKVFLT